MCEIVKRPRSWFTHAEEREVMLVEEDKTHERKMLRMEKVGKLESQVTKYWKTTEEEARRVVNVRRQAWKERDDCRRRAPQSELRHEVWLNGSQRSATAEEEAILARLTSANSTLDWYSLGNGTQSIEV